MKGDIIVDVDDIIDSLDPDKTQCIECGKWSRNTTMVHLYSFQKSYCNKCWRSSLLAKSFEREQDEHNFRQHH